MKTFKEKFEEFFYSLCEWQQLDLVCTYHDYNNDERPYNMDEFDEIMRHCSPMDIALHARHDGFNPHDKYFHFNGCANLESSNDLLEWTDFDCMADWYEWHEHELYRVDRSEWLALEDEDEENEDDEDATGSQE